MAKSFRQNPGVHRAKSPWWLLSKLVAAVGGVKNLLALATDYCDNVAGSNHRSGGVTLEELEGLLAKMGDAARITYEVVLRQAKAGEQIWLLQMFEQNQFHGIPRVLIYPLLSEAGWMVAGKLERGELTAGQVRQVCSRAYQRMYEGQGGIHLRKPPSARKPKGGGDGIGCFGQGD